MRWVAAGWIRARVRVRSERIRRMRKLGGEGGSARFGRLVGRVGPAGLMGRRPNWAVGLKKFQKKKIK